MPLNKKTISASLAALAVALPGASFAQDDSGDMIIVTAQKREQNIQEVPVAVSVVDAQAIERTAAVNIESIQYLVPSVSFRKGTTSKNSALTIRGIGTISFSGAIEPSVSTVVDGVVLGRSGQAFSELYEVEQLEVLRGPQGTLFGKNASAGVVSITTKRPTDEFEATVLADYFEDNEYRVRGRISGPLSDTVKGSLTVAQSAFDGNIFNVYNNKKVNGYDKMGIRGMLQFDPTDTLSILGIVEHNRSEDDCCADLEVRPSGRNPASAAAPNGAFDLDQRRVDHDFETFMVDETNAFSVQVDKELQNGILLTSITAYREWENAEDREGDFTSIGGTANTPVFGVPFQLHDNGALDTKTFTQEFRITSPDDQRLDYVLGLFFMNLDRTATFTRNASCQNNGGQNQPILDANPGLECNANDIVSATSFTDSSVENIAAFGQIGYDLTEAINAFVGFRYTDDQTSFTHTRRNNDEFGRQGVGVRPAAPNSQFSQASGGFDNTFTGEVSDTDFSARIGATLDIGALAGGGNLGTAYASFNQGYKGPGFNVFYNMGTNDQLPIDAETSDSFEIGYKYVTGDFAFAITAYQADIENFQANNFDNSTGVTITRLTNAGDVSTEGVEIDASWSPSDWLSLTAAVALNEAVIEEFNCPVDPGTGQPPANCSDRSGLDLLFSPDLNYTLGANLKLPINDDTDFIGNLTFARVDDQQSLLPNNDGTVNPVGLLPGYDLLDAQVGVSFMEGQYTVSLIAKNILDESFVTTYSGDGFRYQIPRDADRRFGVRFTGRF
ncbi:TonB-dependent receptor [Parvularcula sp. ZS-1/3]|uniref:TonB-dependent receptor n=1 Tax=Parvularcula mediterranea TaxID=2732508 RepID=A0A7Y3RMW9_9PROT|nr:TonB-dependent receptor [Parvularcula mediterranea]NNU17026.1 TonB-dependent receptor [Parvularcula mediterranea]